MRLNHFNEFKRYERNRQLERFANRADVAIVVFCVCLVLAWILGGAA